MNLANLLCSQYLIGIFIFMKEIMNELLIAKVQPRPFQYLVCIPVVALVSIYW